MGPLHVHFGRCIKFLVNITCFQFQCCLPFSLHSLDCRDSRSSSPFHLYSFTMLFVITHCLTKCSCVGGCVVNCGAPDSSSLPCTNYPSTWSRLHSFPRHVLLQQQTAAWKVLLHTLKYVYNLALTRGCHMCSHVCVQVRRVLLLNTYIRSSRLVHCIVSLTRHSIPACSCRMVVLMQRESQSQFQTRLQSWNLNWKRSKLYCKIYHHMHNELPFVQLVLAHFNI